ncbi:MAG: FAD-dependent oxidoreductase [Roseiflexaceae bacterium]
MQARIVICGAGIAGVAVAHALALRGVEGVVLVDERPPLTLTSDKSSECYRDFWPGPGDAMVRLIGASIDRLEALARESQNAFRMNRRGYLYVSRAADGAAQLRQAAEEAAGLGAGPLRVNPREYQPSPLHGWEHAPRGADLFDQPDLIARHFPFLAADTTAVLHARRCGWLSAQQLGMYLLEQARRRGVQLLEGRLNAIEVTNGAISCVELDSGLRIDTPTLINCAGPHAAMLARLHGEELPIFSERHLKFAFEDRMGVIPREAPMVINADPLSLDWSEEERELLAEDPETARLLEQLPAGAHFRPEGEGASPWVLTLWAYDAEPVPEIFPLPINEQFPEIAMRGVASIVPGLQRYVERPPRPIIDGGYYTKTRENRPLIGPMGTIGAYVLAALSGYGVMAACGAADLLAAHVLGEPLPDYASAFLPGRYDDPAYQALLANWGSTGQL